MSVNHFAPERRERRRPLHSRLRRLVPRDTRFFALFDAHAALGVQGVEALAKLLGDLRDGRDGAARAADDRVRAIEELEKHADRVVGDTRALLRRSLLPPYPRDTIVQLIQRLDDVIDLTEDVAQSVHLYHVTRVTPEALRLAELALAGQRALAEAVALLARPDEGRAVLALCGTVDEFEAQADHVFRAAMSRLFREESDLRELIKLKAVYELLEELTDKCKDVASLLETLALTT